MSRPHYRQRLATIRLGRISPLNFFLQKEYILYAPLTKKQKDLYDLTVKGGLRKYLIKQGMKMEESRVEKDEEDDAPHTRGSKAASGSKKRRSQYADALEENDTKYFEHLADGQNDCGDKDPNEMAHEYQLKQASEATVSYFRLNQC
jgi:ATP-dependent DNA helicase